MLHSPHRLTVETIQSQWSLLDHHSLQDSLTDSSNSALVAHISGPRPSSQFKMRGLSRAICLVAAAGVGALPANDAQSTLHKLSSSSNTMVRSMPIINATRIHTVHSSFATATLRLNTTSVSPTVTSTETNKFGFSGTSTATFHSASSTVTLAPNVHWTQDTKEVKNVIPLSPEEGSQMYYGTGGKDPSEVDVTNEPQVC